MHGSVTLGDATQPPASGSAAAMYDAFLSYSHGQDAPLALALQSALHRYAKPWYRLRALRMFLDVANLSSPALWSSLEAALEKSG